MMKIWLPGLQELTVRFWQTAQAVVSFACHGLKGGIHVAFHLPTIVIWGTPILGSSPRFLTMLDNGPSPCQRSGYDLEQRDMDAQVRAAQ